MRKILLFCCFLGVMGGVTDLDGNLYAQSEISNWHAKTELKSHYKIATEQKVYTVVLEDIMRELSVKAGSNDPIGLPLGANTSELQFLIRKNEVLIPSLAASNPHIQTYEGVSTDKSAQIRITASPYGINVKVSIKGGDIYYIQPVSKEEPHVLVSYNAKTILNTVPSACDVEDLEWELAAARPAGPVSVRTCALKTYVIAVAAAGEYTTWAGGQAQALAKITASVNNVNLVFEKDLGIRFLLNSPNAILFTNPATDPYPTTSVVNNDVLSANHDTLTSLLGVNGFDIGHVLNEGWDGGVAGLRSACNDNRKGRGGTGLPNTPTGYDFDMIFAHELGHQLGAEHTFSASNAACGSNINIPTSWEAGGGSSIMGYSGVCVGNFYQWKKSDFFHAGSIEQMTNFLLIDNATCGVENINHPNTQTFSAVAQHSYLVPASTPFKLSLIANDATNNGLTYTWDQMNSLDTNATSGTPYPPSPTAVTGPLFRSYDPDVSETRYFPRLEKIASGDLAYEVLPTISRDMDFRGTVRDNYPGGGCISAQDVKVTTNADCSLYITSHTTAENLGTAGTQQTTTLTWNPATCVPCEYVYIKFSTDSGTTFPYLLGMDPNTGTATFTLPNLPTCNGRFMVECASNIFFNVSSADLTISRSTSCEANGSKITPVSPVAESVGSPNLNLTMNPIYGSPLVIAGSVESTDIESSLIVRASSNGNCINYSNPTYNDVFSFVPTVSGTYTFEGSGHFRMIFNLYAQKYNPSLPCQNFITSSAVGGNNSYNEENKTISVYLCANTRYEFVASNIDFSAAGSPVDYTVSVAGPGALYTDNAAPNANYVYRYIIVGSDGVIKEVKSTPDLSNAAIYIDDDYRVYGLSSWDYTNLNAWQGYHIDLMKQYSYFPNWGWCINFSENYREVRVGSGAPLSNNSVSLLAQWENEKSVKVIWKILNDVKVAHYELERSYDGFTFEKLHIQTSKYYSNSGSYLYNDASLSANRPIIYYRLKSVMQDGSSSYSSIAKISRMFQGLQQITINPNPIKNGAVIVDLGELTEGEYEASVYDMAARLMKEMKLNKTQGVQKYTLDVNGIPSGMYLLHLKGQGVSAQVKFVKE
jgi:hypothetical protein